MNPTTGDHSCLAPPSSSGINRDDMNKGSMIATRTDISSSPGNKIAEKSPKATRRGSSSSKSTNKKKKKAKKQSKKAATRATTATNEEYTTSSGDHLWELGSSDDSSPSPSPLHYPPSTSTTSNERQPVGPTLSPAWDPLILNEASWKKHGVSSNTGKEMTVDAVLGGSMDDTGSSPSQGSLAKSSTSQNEDALVTKALNEQVEGAWADFVNSPFVGSGAMRATSFGHESATSFTTPTTATSTDFCTTTTTSVTSSTDIRSHPSCWRKSSSLPYQDQHATAVILESPTPTSSDVEYSLSASGGNISGNTTSSSSRGRLTTTAAAGGAMSTTSSGQHLLLHGNVRHDSFKSVSVASTMSGNTDKYNTVASLMSAESRYNACGLLPEEEDHYYKTMARMTMMPTQHIRFHTSHAPDGMTASSLSQNSNSMLSISTHSKTTSNSSSWKGSGSGGGSIPIASGGPLTIFEGEPATYSSSISFSVGGAGNAATTSSLDGGATMAGKSCASTIATDDGSCSIRSSLFCGKEQLMVEDLMSRGVPHHIAIQMVKEHIDHLRTVLWNNRTSKFATSNNGLPPYHQQHREPPRAEAVLLNLPENIMTTTSPRRGVVVSAVPTTPTATMTQQPGAVCINGASETSLSFNGSLTTFEESMPYPPSSKSEGDGCSSGKQVITAYNNGPSPPPPVQATAILFDDDDKKEENDTTRSDGDGTTSEFFDPADGILVAEEESKPLSVALLLREPTVRRFLMLMLATLVIVITVSFIVVNKTDKEEDDIFDNPVSPLGQQQPTAMPSAPPSTFSEDFLEAAATVSGWGPVNTEGSPQRKAVAWLSSVDQYPLGGDSTTVFDEHRFTQRYTLAVLYFSAHGEKWTNHQDDDLWLHPEMHECGWSSAIFCKDDMTVTELNLNNKGLSGTIPRELQELELRVLRLSDNDIHGTIPPDLCEEYTSLGVLELDHNKLTGSIPEDIAWCKDRLQTLDLSHNSLTGTLPWRLQDLMSLEDLDLSRNNLSGTLPSNVLDGMSSLGSIDLRSNMFSGRVPESFFLGELPFLSRVRLDDNRFSGALPPISSIATSGVKTFTASRNQINSRLVYEADSWSSSEADVTLETLDLSDNFLRGTLPSSMFGSSSASLLSTLQYLDLSDNALSGSFPGVDDDDGIPNSSSSLEHLSIARNKFVGSFDWNHVLFQGGRLTHLDLSDNGFEGELDILDMFLRKNVRLETLVLSRNRFGGGGSMSTTDTTTSELPTYFGSTSNLQNLQLASCGLDGTIPTEIGELSKLENVDLSKNNLGGLVPTEMGNLYSLRQLNLEKNSLVGPWPDEMNDLPNLIQLALSGNNLLSGFITPDMCNQANVTAGGMGCNMVGPCIPVPSNCG